MASTDLSRLVLDANIMVSALIGRSFDLLLILLENGVRLMAPVEQLAETRATITRLGIAEDTWTDAQMHRLLAVVMPLNPPLLAPYEKAARLRLHARGQPDWPVLAGCMATDAAAWSNDRDLFGCGVPVWSTIVLQRQLEGAAV